MADVDRQPHLPPVAAVHRLRRARRGVAVRRPVPDLRAASFHAVPPKRTCSRSTRSDPDCRSRSTRRRTANACCSGRRSRASRSTSTCTTPTAGGISTRFSRASQAAGIRAIRVDAAGFAVKKAGTSCFMIPETLAFIADLTARARSRGLEVLVEVHGHPLDQARIARQVDWVYDLCCRHSYCTRSHARRDEPAPVDRHPAAELRHRARHARRHRRAGRRPGSGRTPGVLTPAEIRALVEVIHDAAAARASRPPAAPRTISTPIRSTARSTTRSAAETTSTSSLGPFSVSCRASRRSTTSGCWPAVTTSTLLAPHHVGRDINRHYYTADDVRRRSTSPSSQSLAP